MNIKYYVTLDDRNLCNGRYLSDIHGDDIPTEAIEVSNAVWESLLDRSHQLINDEAVPVSPEQLDLWNTQDTTTELSNMPFDERRKREYDKVGATIQALTVAMFEEDQTEIDRLAALRQDVKNRIPAE